MSKNIETLLRLLKPEELELIPPIPTGQTPLWEHWEEFVEKYLRTGKSPSTVQNAKDSMKILILHLKVFTIEDCMDFRKIENLLHEYKEKRNIKATTFNSYRKGFNTYFIWLERYEYIPRNPIKKIPKCAEKYQEKLVLSQEKVDRIIAHLSTRRQTRLQRARNIFFIDLLRFTGARPCELAALKVTDVTQSKETYKVVIHGAKQKGKNRYYHLVGYVRDSYERYILIRNKIRPDEEHLFISSSKRTGWGQKGIRYLLKKLRQDLGFNITAYSFRRYVATKLYREGIEPHKISDYLGHTRASTTRRYLEDICAWTDEAGGIMAG
jgi:site-specific recombinase XerD